ncbi:hypothetical protein C8R43DRAFT_1127159 [Mycena crocata]|nr:hypothetical protein C8R43DRAFT_1127159 [Mycena crocata]
MAGAYTINVADSAFGGLANAGGDVWERWRCIKRNATYHLNHLCTFPNLADFNAISPGPTFSIATTADDVAAAFSEEIKGRNVPIIGTSINGMRFEAARVIAKYANLVIITGYNDERHKNVPAANIRRLTIDLASLAAVHRAAAEVNAYPEAPRHSTPGRILQTHRRQVRDSNGRKPPGAVPLHQLLASTTSTYTLRVVYVSSAAHAMCAGVDFDTLEHPVDEGYDSAVPYWQCKSANILTAIELSKRFKGKLSVLDNGIMEWKTLAQGAATILAAAFDPRISPTSRVPTSATQM